MSIRGMFSNINRALGSTTPQQRAQMLAIAGGSSPSPAMGNALYGQSQAIMQALQDEQRLKAQAEQSEQDRRMRMSEGAQDRDQRMDELDRTISAEDRRESARALRLETRDRLDAKEMEARMLAANAGAKQTRFALAQTESQLRSASAILKDTKSTPEMINMAWMTLLGGNPGAALGNRGVFDPAAWGAGAGAAPPTGADAVDQVMVPGAPAATAQAHSPAATPTTGGPAKIPAPAKPTNAAPEIYPELYVKPRPLVKASPNDAYNLDVPIRAMVSSLGRTNPAMDAQNQEDAKKHEEFLRWLKDQALGLYKP